MAAPRPENIYKNIQIYNQSYSANITNARYILYILYLKEVYMVFGLIASQAYFDTATLLYINTTYNFQKYDFVKYTLL